MTRTKTLVIIGCFMLALAVLAALELRSGESVLAEGQVVMGALSKDASTPVTPAQGNEIEPSPLAGALLPLDNGTLRTSSAEKPSARVDGASPSAFSEATSPASSIPVTQTVVTPALQPLPPTPVLEVSGKINQPSPTAEAPAGKPVVETSSTRSNTGKPNGLIEETTTSQPVNTSETAKTTALSVPPKASESSKVSTPTPKTSAAITPAGSVSTAKTIPSKPITTAAPEKLLPGEKAIIWTHFQVEAKQAVFRFTAASAIEGKAFTLTDPDRYVVDLKGSWAFDLPKVPSNAFVKSIRAGRHETNTRLVFDLTKPKGNAQLVKVNKETLEIRLR